MNHAATFATTMLSGALLRALTYDRWRVHNREHDVEIVITVDRSLSTDRVTYLSVLRRNRPLPGFRLSAATPAERADARSIYRWVCERLAMGEHALAMLEEDARRLHALWGERDEVEA